MSNFKYKYYRLPEYGTAIADIGVYIGFKDAKNIIVREKIDLDGSIFSNDGTSEYTFVEFAGYGVNETRDGVDLYGNGSLYIRRKDLNQVLPYCCKPENEFEKQIEEYVKSKKSCDERKKIKLSLQEKLDIAVKALEEYANKHNWTNSCRYNKKDVFHKELSYTVAEEALAKIKEIK